MPDVTVTIPDFTQLPNMTAGVFAMRVEQERQDAAASAMAEANQLREQLATVTAERDMARADLDAMNRENKRLSDELAALKAAMNTINVKPAILPQPPVVLPETQPEKPVRVKAVISKTELRNVAGLTITLDTAPSEKKDAQAKEHLNLAADLGFNTVRFLRNFQETSLDHERGDDARNLVGYAQGLGLTVVFDTVELVIRRINAEHLTPIEKADKRKKYFNMLHELGGAGLFINDADRDDLSNELALMIGQIRAASDLPLFASLTAGAKLDEFKGSFNYTECQTFGKLDEFRRFVKLPCDVLCIDGQRSTSTTYLNAMLGVLLESGRDNFMVYTSLDGKTDWLDMPETVAVYREFLKEWHAAR